MFESFPQTSQPPKEVNKQTNRKCTGAKPLCPEGFKNSCTCTKASPASSEEPELLEGSSPSANPPMCCGHHRNCSDAAAASGESRRGSRHRVCVGGGYQEHPGFICLPPKRSQGHRDAQVPKSVGAKSLHRKTEKDLWWDLIQPCLQPMVSAHHISRSRISPGWSHSPGVSTP